MNRTLLMGRLTKDPVITKSGDKTTAKFTLAVERRGAGATTTADFISCVAFGKNGDFAEKFLKKGMRILLEGRILTGNYTDKTGKTVYTTEVCADAFEFCESKNTATINESVSDMPMNAGFAPVTPKDSMPFVNIPSGLDEDLPFAPPTGR